MEEKLTNPTAKIKLKKFLPYFINLSAAKKEPLAYIQQGTKIFFLDSEEFSFSVSAFNNPDLPIIRFSKSFYRDTQYLKIKDILTLVEVQKALKLLQVLRKKQGDFPEEIFTRNSLIEIESPLNILWIIILNKKELRISLGYEFFELKIKTLALIFNRLQQDLSRVKQIDARYSDKIILNYH